MLADTVYKVKKYPPLKMLNSFIIQSDVPLSHQIEHLIASSPRPMTEHEIRMALTGDKNKAKAITIDVSSRLTRLKKSGVLECSKSGKPSADAIRWGRRSPVNAWSLAKTNIFAGDYTPFFIRQSAERKQRREEEKALRHLKRMEERRAREEIRHRERLRKQREQMSFEGHWTKVANQLGDDWNILKRAVDTVGGSADIREDMRQAGIIHLLEGGDPDDLVTVIRRAKRDIFHLASFSRNTVSLYASTYWDDQSGKKMIDEVTYGIDERYNYKKGTWIRSAYK